MLEKDKISRKAREIGRGEIIGFGVFTGLSAEEEPNIFSQEPAKGLQFFFKKENSEQPFDFLSEPLN
ncbi:MAG: hypothetical protein U9P63_02615 [Patescibacteria group bacterium]|nr:hypothetical protein [Patescibacteria group bacterium]